ncbi:MAG TPA: type III-B CRISPR module-associated protein Cmr3 [Bryobacteraceae bacterium]|nr:type III-B CRISPR module-associated protein Cmr3 [Bryobacteraceae bacterium]
MSYVFLEPVDVLFLRGNEGFGDPGSYGESYMPPWPSVIAGALRSRILADDRCDLAAFARGLVRHPSLGTPAEPGPFRVLAFHVARRFADARIQLLMAPPADLFVESSGGSPRIRSLRPLRLESLAPTLASSYPLPLHPVLAQPRQGKPAEGYWLTEEGWREYLEGKFPRRNHLVKHSELWCLEPRVGVGLDPATRAAAEGRLFTSVAVAMRAFKGNVQSAENFAVGFLVEITGAEAPRDGLLRVGGDGRGMVVSEVCGYAPPEPDYDAIVRSHRFRMILASPGIFPEGWLPTGLTCGSWEFDLHGVRARLVSACVARAEVVSGWDLARQQPKPAWRAAPAGSVYWFDELEADEDALRRLVAEGLWSANWLDRQRRAEGFNRIWLAQWAN